MAALVPATMVFPDLGDAAAKQAALEAWLEVVAELTEGLELPHYPLAVMRDSDVVALRDFLGRARIISVGVPDDTPYSDCWREIAGAAAAGKKKLDDEMLRRCFAFRALGRLNAMRVILGACGEMQVEPDRALVWFLDIIPANKGTPEDVNRAVSLLESGGCVVLPQPEPGTPLADAQVIVDVNDLTLCIKPSDFRAANGLEAGAPFAIRAPAANGFGWAMAALVTFSDARMNVGIMPVTAMWLFKDSGAKASGMTRAGVDYGWFWSAASKGIRVVTL